MIMNLPEKEQAAREARLRSAAAFVGILPDPNMTLVEMRFEFGHDRPPKTLVVDLDALAPDFALDIRGRIAAGLFELTPEAGQVEALENAEFRPTGSAPATPQSTMSALCYD